MPPPTRTPTPTPKRATSLVFEKSKSGKKFKKAANYGIGKLAEGWSASMGRMRKPATGGFKLEGSE